MIDLIIHIVKANPIICIIDVIFINLLNTLVNEIINCIDINTNIVIIRYGKIDTFIFNKIFNIFNINFVNSIINKISVIEKIRFIIKIWSINYILKFFLFFKFI